MLSQSDDLACLRAANPERVDAARVQGAGAQATLTRILSEPVPDRPARGWFGGRRLGRSSRRLTVALAIIMVGGGAAFAATDPGGWWSSNPTAARYGANPAVHASTPTATYIGCTRSGAVLRCAPDGAGQLYLRLDTVSAPAAGLTRQRALAGIATARARGKLTAVQAARLRADIAAVPDSFFAEFELASRYGTYSSGYPVNDRGETLVPPPGIPAFLACERVGTGLGCQNLNGDDQVPIGAGIYAAQSAADWRRVRPPAETYTPLPPGISFTPAEYRLLIDLLRYGTVTSRSSRPRVAERAPTGNH